MHGAAEPLIDARLCHSWPASLSLSLSFRRLVPFTSSDHSQKSSPCFLWVFFPPQDGEGAPWHSASWHNEWMMDVPTTNNTPPQTTTTTTTTTSHGTNNLHPAKLSAENRSEPIQLQRTTPLRRSIHSSRTVVIEANAKLLNK